jgi:hypothetical protein
MIKTSTAWNLPRFVIWATEKRQLNINDSMNEIASQTVATPGPAKSALRLPWRHEFSKGSSVSDRTIHLEWKHWHKVDKAGHWKPDLQIARASKI